MVEDGDFCLFRLQYQLIFENHFQGANFYLTLQALNNAIVFVCLSVQSDVKILKLFLITLDHERKPSL